MYTYKTTVKLHDTDAAGVLFFANYFRLAHEAYETFMASIGYDFYTVIHEADFLVLIVHAEADFKTPLHVGDRVTIEMQTSRLGRSSFTLVYNLKNEAGEVVATASSVHAVIKKETVKPISMPRTLREQLEQLHPRE